MEVTYKVDLIIDYSVSGEFGVGKDSGKKGRGRRAR
jgi:hypothetical protein